MPWPGRRHPIDNPNLIQTPMGTAERLPLPAAVVFDMDGTLLDTERLGIECWHEAFREVGVAMPAAAIASTVGCDTATKTRIFLANNPPDSPPDIGPAEANVAWLAALARHFQADGVPLKPGALETLQLLKRLGIPAAVATTSPRRLAEWFLGTAGLLPFLEVVVCREDVADTKPAPAVYFETAYRLGLYPTEIWAVEDSSNGIQSSVAASMPTFFVPDLEVVPEAVRRLATRECATLHEFASLLPRPVEPVPSSPTPPTRALRANEPVAS